MIIEPNTTGLDEHSVALADGVEELLPGWVVRSVRLVLEQRGLPLDAAAEAAAIDAGRTAAAEVGSAIRALLALDVDDQATTPLTLLRSAVRYPTEVLTSAGVEPARRDQFDIERFPADAYGLTPASFGDIDPGLAAAGFAWGAWKAKEHMRRHGRGGGAA